MTRQVPATHRAFRCAMARWACGAVAAGLLASTASGQIADQVRIFAYDVFGGGNAVLRFDRKLSLVGSTNVSALGGIVVQETPIAIDALGRSWIAFDPLNTTQLLRIDNEGTLLPSTWLADTPVNVLVDADGCAFATTRIGLSAPGPAYGVDSDGNVLWSNIAGPGVYNMAISYPKWLTVSANGEVWIAGGTAVSQFGLIMPVMVRISKAAGDVMTTLPLPGNPENHSAVCQCSASGDGTLWAFVCGGPYRWLIKTDGVSVLQSFPINGGTNEGSYQVHVDAQDRPHVLSLYNAAGGNGSQLLRYDPSDPAAPDSVYQLGGAIMGWAFGPGGEDVYAVIAPPSAPQTRRLERMNLITATRSSVPLEPAWWDASLAYGDTTGFLHANVIDRIGDNDGDGAANSDETAAGSSPYDATSTPDGPKVYLSFQPVTNAITLTWGDRDGLFDPVGGLDLTSISLTASGYGEVMSYLWPFLTSVSISADVKSATVVLGGLPLPEYLKIALEARVQDKTGFVGWDWQVTPPGDL